VSRGRSAVASIVLVSLLLLAAGAHAALVAIDPVKVLLSGAAPSKSVTLRNNGTEKVRFQVSAFTWQQSLGGEMVLAPTSDLVFFPSLVELAPGETRRLRVTTTAQASSTEKNFRLFVDELPPMVGTQGGAIRVLTRFGLPVFLAPDAPRPVPALKMELSQGKLSVRLENRGNAHFVAQSVRLVGRGADGAIVLQEDLQAWYVLAGGTRVFELSPSGDVCSKLAQLNGSANTDHGPARADYKVPPGACAKP
jgi:fimbrial chaperone protein